MNALEGPASHLSSEDGCRARDFGPSSAPDVTTVALDTCPTCLTDYDEDGFCPICGRVRRLKYDGRVRIPCPERAHAPEGA